MDTRATQEMTAVWADERVDDPDTTTREGSDPRAQQRRDEGGEE